MRFEVIGLSALVTALLHGFTEICTHDRHQIHAPSALGLASLRSPKFFATHLRQGSGMAGTVEKLLKRGGARRFFVEPCLASRLCQPYGARDCEAEGVATQRALASSLTARRSDPDFVSWILSSFPLRPLRPLREAIIFGACIPLYNLTRKFFVLMLAMMARL